MKITVNGKTKVVKPRVSYSELIMLVFQNGSRPEKPTITYWAKSEKSRGTIAGSVLPGETIDVCDGMIFNVADTSNA